eukprot:snap_masked-scaffold_21-processed-gene-5.62-mRNA-1 protein AED:1.00 eAED:1.00 QI:0/0/0/0/1/1/2/0/843
MNQISLKAKENSENKVQSKQSSSSAVLKRVLCCVPINREKAEETETGEESKQANVQDYMQFLILVFIFYLQQVALIIIGDLNYPKQWEDSVSWLRDVLFPDVNLDLSPEDTSVVLLAIYGFPIFIHALIFVASEGDKPDYTPRIFFSIKTIIFSKLILLLSISLIIGGINFGKVGFVFYAYILGFDIFQRIRHNYIEKVWLPEKKKIGFQSNSARIKFWDFETSIYSIISASLVTPMMSITIQQGLLNKNTLLAVIFSIIGFSIVFYLLAFYYAVYKSYPKNKKILKYVGIRSHKVPIKIFHRSLEGYQERFKWLQILFFIEKISLVLPDTVLDNQTPNGIPIGGLFSFCIILFVSILVYARLPYKNAELNRIDTLTRLSNLLLLGTALVFTTVNNISEDLANLIISIIFSLQGWLNYFPLFVFARFLIRMRRNYQIKQKWKDIDSVQKVENILRGRKNRGVSKYEWLTFTGDQKLMVLCAHRGKNKEISDLESAVEVPVILYNLEDSPFFLDLLKHGLSENLRITNIDLESVGISSIGVGFLFESKVFERLPWLKSLNLNTVELESTGALNLFTSLVETRCTVAEISFNFNQLTSEHFGIFGEFLRRNDMLAKLHLSVNPEIGPKGVEIVLQSMQAENFSCLKLINVGLDDSNARLLKKFLSEARKLEVFDLNSNQLTHRSLPEIYDKLANLPNKTEIETSLWMQSDWQQAKQVLFHLNESSTALAKNKKLNFGGNVMLIDAPPVVNFSEVVDCINKKKCFKFENGEIVDFSDFLYECAHEGINGYITAAVSTLTINEKQVLRGNLLEMRKGKTTGESIKNIVENEGLYRVSETLEALKTIF